MSTLHHPEVLHRADLDVLRTAPDDLSLGRVLAVLDLLSLAVAGLLVTGAAAALPPRLVDVTTPWFAVWIVGVGFGAITAFGLHQRRRCAITSVELSRIGRASVAVGVLALLLLQAADSSSPYWTGALVVVAMFVTLVLSRGAFRSWLRLQRQRGRFVTPVAVVGERAAAQAFARHMAAHPESGFLPVAHVDVDASPLVDLSDDADDLPRVGHVTDELDDLERHGVRSAVLLVDRLQGEEVADVVRATADRFDHVQVVTNLVGVSHTRLVPTPLVGEMTFYLESTAASPWQRVVKRGTDVVVSALLLVLTAPVMALAALAVRLTDGGPALYAQERVGRGGRRIRIHKFRSMVVDADARAADLDNDRDGPLFKLRADPRITRVGRYLRATSLDELPQLWSILRGDMSLVGPRPALPAEVATFDQVHQRRHEVRPGLTGLWQVEDRDHPDFERYRRHDVFYVENWSLSLDLAILLQTAVVVTTRAVRAVLPARDGVLE